MIKEQMNKIKEIFKTNDGNNKKKIENLVVFVIILIITMIIINMILNDDSNQNNTQEYVQEKVLAQEENIIDNDTNDLEDRLEQILSSIQGVGSVKVLITYSQTSQTQAMYNEDNTTSQTEEADTRRRQ